MDLERLKEAWLHRESEGYLVEKPAGESALDTRRLPEKNRAFAGRERRRLVMALFLTVNCVMLLLSEHRPMVRVGMLFLAVTFPLIAIIMARLGRRFRVQETWLPTKSFLQREHERIDARIWLRRLTLWLYAAPIFALGLILIPSRVSALKCVAYLIAVIVLAAVCVLHETREKRKSLAMRNEADMNLRRLESEEL